MGNLTLIEGIKIIWRYFWNILTLGNNISKVLESQKRIEEAISSPERQLTELEIIKGTVELLKENNEQRIRKLEAESKGEISKHKKEIEKLQGENKVLSEYRDKLTATAEEAIEIIKQKNKTIDKLKREVSQLRNQAPSPLTQLLMKRL